MRTGPIVRSKQASMHDYACTVTVILLLRAAHRLTVGEVFCQGARSSC